VPGRDGRGSGEKGAGNRDQEWQAGGDPLAAFLFPGLKIVGDIESPQYTDAEWNEFLEREARHVAGDED
jgi:hypothetical protein